MSDETFSGSVRVGTHLLIGFKPGEVRLEPDLSGNLLVNKIPVGSGTFVPIANSPATVAVMAVAVTNVASLSTSTPVVDGYSLLTGDYVLLTAQSTASQNGIWQVPASGAWTRPAAFPSGGVVYGLRTVAMNGAIYANSAWNLTTPAAGITIDTTAQVWALQQTPEDALALSNVATANASTSKHGLLPILSGAVTDMLMGDGTFAPPNLPARGIYESTDFLNANGSANLPWLGAAITSGNITGGTKDKDHPGVIGLQNAATTVNSGYSFVAGTFFVAGGETCEMIFDVALTAGMQVYWGYHNTLSATAPTKGVWLNINGTTVEGQTGGTAVQTTGTTYTLVQGTFYHAKIVIAANGQSASFFLYDSTGANLLWSDTCAVAANMPAVTDSLRNTLIAINTTSIALSTIFFVDYLNLNIPRALAR